MANNGKILKWKGIGMKCDRISQKYREYSPHNCAPSNSCPHRHCSVGMALAQCLAGPIDGRPNFVQIFVEVDENWAPFAHGTLIEMKAENIVRHEVVVEHAIGLNVPLYGLGLNSLTQIEKPPSHVALSIPPTLPHFLAAFATLEVPEQMDLAVNKWTMELADPQ